MKKDNTFVIPNIDTKNTAELLFLMLNISIYYNYLKNTDKKFVFYKSRIVLQKAGAYNYLFKFMQKDLVKIITPSFDTTYNQLLNYSTSYIEDILRKYKEKYPQYYGFVVNNS